MNDTILYKLILKLLNLKHEELRELYAMMMLDDGCYGKEFCCQDKEIIDFIQDKNE